jgi:hypothetical protein
MIPYPQVKDLSNSTGKNCHQGTYFLQDDAVSFLPTNISSVSPLQGRKILTRSNAILRTFITPHTSRVPAVTKSNLAAQNIIRVVRARPVARFASNDFSVPFLGADVLIEADAAAVFIEGGCTRTTYVGEC